MSANRVTIKIEVPKVSPNPQAPRRGPFDPPIAKPGSWQDGQRKRTGF